MNKLVIGNWKMNGSITLVDEFISGLDSQIILGIPSIFVMYAHCKNPNLKIAAQDCSVFNEYGAHTGEISAKMFADAGCNYAIVGHSERRKTSNFDTVSGVLLKLQNIINCGMTAILCVDEHYHELIDETTFLFLEAHSDKVIVAYEPISAIGTGIIPSLSNIEAVINNIKKDYFNVKTLYGGSVNIKNIDKISSCSPIDGVLVGGASLKLDEINTMASLSAR